MLILGGAYYALELYRDRNLSSHQMMANASRAMADGEYLKAGTLFDEVLVRYPDDLLVGEAKFMSAYALQLIPDSDKNAALHYDNSVSRFERFLVEYPEHEKTSRAETLLGMMYFRTNNFEKAIELLDDPERRMKDPGAYLSTLRTLARSYAASSLISKSHNAFLMAATLDSNMTPEEDYLELASLYVALAERSVNDSMIERYRELAIEQWDHAIDVPGVLSYLKNEIQLKREHMIEEMAQGRSTAQKGKYESLRENDLKNEDSQ